MNLGKLFRLSDPKTRSISPENLTGEPGKGGMATLENGNAKNAARDFGQGWKVNPYIVVKPGETCTLAMIRARNDSECIDGILWTRSVLKKI